jgi:hypothetical protein
VKKITIILLLSIYSLSTLGLSLKSFYCCGKLKSVSVTLSQDLQKKCTKADNSKDCCQTKYQVVKVKDTHVIADHVQSPVKDFIVLNLFSSSFQTIHFPFQKDLIEHKNNAPPLIHGVPGYIFNCVFRI